MKSTIQLAVRKTETLLYLFNILFFFLYDTKNQSVKPIRIFCEFDEHTLNNSPVCYTQFSSYTSERNEIIHIDSFSMCGDILPSHIFLALLFFFVQLFR